MDSNTKFRSLGPDLSYAGASRGRAALHQTVLLRTLLYTFPVVHILLGIVLFFQYDYLFFRYVTEDGYIEYLTAFFLLATSVYCLYKAPGMKGKWPMAFYYVTAAVFFFGFGEEISWGQRIFGFGVPERMEEINPQGEFNFHNIHVGGLNLNKLIFGKLMYAGVFVYFWAFPALYRRKRWFKQLTDKIRLPLPSPMQTLLYTLLFLSLLLIGHGKKWELQEFALVSFIFYAFLMPCNKVSAGSEQPHLST